MEEVKINVRPSSSDNRLRPTPLANLPRADLLDGNREEYFSLGVLLYEASITGDWEAAKAILDKRPEFVRFAITEKYETALHVAVSADYTKLMEDFVQNLIDLMEMEDLLLQNKNRNNAFCVAAAAGNVKMAEIMAKKNKKILDIPGDLGMMPLYQAALFGKHAMVRHLYDNSQKMTGAFWTHKKRNWVVLKCVQVDMFDVALKIVMDCQELAFNQDVLLVLAQKTGAFNRRERNINIDSIFRIIHQNPETAEKDNDALILLRIIWETIKKLPKQELDDMLKGPPDPPSAVGKPRYSSRILFIAAERGNTRFIVELIRAYPDLMWNVNDDRLNIIHIAVMHHHHDIYLLLYELGSMKDLITPLEDKDGNNMLHLVGKTSVEMRTQASGASLLMQRELLWFKAVERMMPLSVREMENMDGLTPYELFSKNNQDLVSHGLKWTKDCMVVATLIITVAFAVAFTVPGGYNQDNGIPMFIHESPFVVFVIADAISLFTSSASLLVFLSILTSSHSQRDFFYLLPKRLMIGLGTLFISVTAMMITFSASFFVLYRNKLKWVPILIGVFATILVISFVALQFPLLVDVFRSIYDSRYLFKPKKRMLYTRTRRSNCSNCGHFCNKITFQDVLSPYVKGDDVHLDDHVMR